MQKMRVEFQHITYVIILCNLNLTFFLITVSLVLKFESFLQISKIMSMEKLKRRHFMAWKLLLNTFITIETIPTA